MQIHEKHPVSRSAYGYKLPHRKRPPIFYGEWEQVPIRQLQRADLPRGGVRDKETGRELSLGIDGKKAVDSARISV